MEVLGSMFVWGSITFCFVHTGGCMMMAESYSDKTVAACIAKHLEQHDGVLQFRSNARMTLMCSPVRLGLYTLRSLCLKTIQDHLSTVTLHGGSQTF